MNNYYPLSRVTRQFPGELILATPTDKKGWSYLIAGDDGDWLKLETNLQHRITDVSFTHKYKGLGMALKRAKTQGHKVCRYTGLASYDRNGNKRLANIDSGDYVNNLQP